VVTIDGNPWFTGSDILRVLFGGASGLGHHYDKLAADERRKVKRIHLGGAPGKGMVLISESGLYKLIMRSDKPVARPFQDWVTREVLPSIRKTGGYALGAGEVMPLPTSFARALRAHAETPVKYP